MTTEEKAKAYEMALEAARKELGVDRKEWEVVKRVLHNIFPELRESEDEKIRKAIIAGIKRCADAGSIFGTVIHEEGVSYHKVLAWLEKQKYDRMKPIYDARESFESALEKAWNDYHNGYENVDKLEDDYVECAHAKGFREGFLYGIEKQKEQKPAEKQDYSGLTDLERAIHRGFLYAGVENVPVTIVKETAKDCLAQIKPAEWSEEKEKQVDDYAAEVIKWEDEHKDWDRQVIRATAYHFFNLQPKQEWSEEDEAAFGDLMWCIEQARKSAKDENDMGNIWFAENWVKGRLKSLRPQPHWKPTEEQMDALNRLLCVGEFSYIGQATKLQELYINLKKLM